ncbi:hypothetical protein [Paracoccus sp. M683]|uniref:hypothetical protein n=1 Tax=Paracoccus sp. M683 TaxID=2594268 RepID=UPI00163DC382|nr:hypothetical protein [Paracoccus sp. M683]
MSDIRASERRLAAALDRIDYLLETAPPRGAGGGPAVDPAGLQARLDQALADNERLQAAVDAMRPAPQSGAELAGSGDPRLADLADQAARLSSANEELIAANRGLIEAVSGQTDQVEAVAVALEAEIEALRAARAAEISQLAEIMAELQRMLADSAATDAPFAADVAVPDRPLVQAEVVSFGDEAGVPELTREADPAFGAVYGDDDDGVDADDEAGEAGNGGR